jgi:hypothetical protein
MLAFEPVQEFKAMWTKVHAFPPQEAIGLKMDLTSKIAVSAFIITAGVIGAVVYAYGIDLGLFWTAIVS